MLKNKTGSFKGILNEPLEPLEIGLLASEAQRNELINERVHQEKVKMLALLEHFDIKPGDQQWYELAKRLAMEIVPGMKEKVKRGPKAKWTDLTIALLKAEVESKVEDVGVDVIAACADLARREPWASFVNVKEGTYYGPDPAEAIRRAYYQQVHEGLVSVAKDARLYHLSVNDEKGWNRFIVDSLNEKKTD